MTQNRERSEGIRGDRQEGRKELRLKLPCIDGSEDDLVDLHVTTTSELLSSRTPSPQSGDGGFVTPLVFPCEPFR